MEALQSVGGGQDDATQPRLGPRPRTGDPSPRKGLLLEVGFSDAVHPDADASTMQQRPRMSMDGGDGGGDVCFKIMDGRGSLGDWKGARGVHSQVELGDEVQPRTRRFFVCGGWARNCKKMILRIELQLQESTYLANPAALGIHSGINYFRSETPENLRKKRIFMEVS